MVREGGQNQQVERDLAGRARQAPHLVALMMTMEYRVAIESDLDLLAEWNHQLIRDEGHRSPMTVSELRERMTEWLGGGAYALYKESATEVYLRQLFVRRSRRREGLGQQAVRILRTQLWPQDKRLTVEVLTANGPALAFWRSVGYEDYCLTLEIMPGKEGE